MHAWTVGVEQAHNFDTKIVLPPIVEEERLRASLSFVVTGTGTNWVHVSPVGVRLRMFERVPVHLGRACQKDLGVCPLGQTEHVYGTVHSRLGGLNGISLIVDGASWAGEVENLIDLDVQGESDIVSDYLKPWTAEQMFNVLLGG